MKRIITMMVLAAIIGLTGCSQQVERISGVVMPDSLTGARPNATPNRLASDPRTALRDEAFYSLRQDWWNVNPAVCANGTVVRSNWNYLLSDINAYSHIKAWYGGYASIWTGWPSYYTNMDVYSRTALNRYGQNTGTVRTHLGQCRGATNLQTYRSGTFQAMFPPYGTGPFKPISQARVGDIIEWSAGNHTGHTAVVVGILAGVEGSSVTKVVVIDSNYVGDEEVGMHLLAMTGSGAANLANYRVLALQLK